MSYVSEHALYGLGGVDDTAQKLLTRFGIGWNNTVRAVYYVNMNVGTTDFGSDAVKVLTQAVQAGLKQIGRYGGPIDGVMGPRTVAALEKMFPGRWRYMTWYNILSQIASKSLGVGVPQKVASVLGADDGFFTSIGKKIFGEAKQTVAEIAKPVAKKPKTAGISTTPAAPPPPAEAGFSFGGLLSNPMLIAAGVFGVLYFTVGRKKAS